MEYYIENHLEIIDYVNLHFYQTLVNLHYLKKNFSVQVCINISDVVKDSDLVIIASPLSSYKEILLSIQSNLKKNAILIKDNFLD